MSSPYGDGGEHTGQLLGYETELPPDEAPEPKVEPIPVYLCEPAVTIDTIAQHASCYTIVLTEDEPVQVLMPLDPFRTRAEIISLDEMVVICHSYQQAKDPANQDATLTNPNGTVLPASGSLPFYIPVFTTGELWIVGNTFPSRVSVINKRRTQ